MKDNNLFFDRQNRRGGALLPKYYDAFARYFARYLQAYREAGVEFWAVTPENEPMGNDGSWESMDLSPEAEATFIAEHLGPILGQEFPDVKIFCFDQNTFEADRYTAAVYDRNPKARDYTAGTALHWYGSTISCFPEILDSLHALYPDKILMHTEGCIDNLGRPGWLSGVGVVWQRRFLVGRECHGLGILHAVVAGVASQVLGCTPLCAVYHRRRQPLDDRLYRLEQRARLHWRSDARAQPLRRTGYGRLRQRHHLLHALSLRLPSLLAFHAPG